MLNEPRVVRDSSDRHLRDHSSGDRPAPPANCPRSDRGGPGCAIGRSGARLGGAQRRLRGDSYRGSAQSRTLRTPGRRESAPRQRPSYFLARRILIRIPVSRRPSSRGFPDHGRRVYRRSSTPILTAGGARPRFFSTMGSGWRSGRPAKPRRRPSTTQRIDVRSCSIWETNLPRRAAIVITFRPYFALPATASISSRPRSWIMSILLSLGIGSRNVTSLGCWSPPTVPDDGLFPGASCTCSVRLSFRWFFCGASCPRSSATTERYGWLA